MHNDHLLPWVFHGSHSPGMDTLFSNHDYFGPSFVVIMNNIVHYRHPTSLFFLCINHGPFLLESAISFGSFRVEYPSMPTCNCETNGCRLEGGVQLPLRTVRDHAHVDQGNRYERARIASEEALRDQEEAIATQLASMTLADQVSQPSRAGGRLWGRSLPNHSTDQPADDPPSTADRTTHRQRIDHALTHLCSLEKDLNTVNSRALLQLSELGTPSAPNTPFPLKPLIVDLRDIMDQVSGVNSRLASIRETKSSILTRCEDLLSKLKNTQRCWVDQAKEIVELKADGLPELNAGMHHHKISSI